MSPQPAAAIDSAPGPCVHMLLPVHNRKAITLQFVNCLRRQTHAAWRLILIDDGSTDGTADAVRAVVPDCTVLTGRGQWWWGGSLHQGYEYLRHQPPPDDDLVLICNDDTIFEPDFLACAVKALAGRKGAMLLAQLYDQDGGGFMESGVHADWRTLNFEGVADPARINCFSTRGLFQRVDDFLALGGFHPHLLPHYGSDYEYTMRAHRLGRQLLTDPSVRLSADNTTTGIRELAPASLAGYLRQVFSKRSVPNPWYWSMFILLACPPRLVPVNLYRIWKSFAATTLRVIAPKDGPMHRAD